jgi:hypothetical protein
MFLIGLKTSRKLAPSPPTEAHACDRQDLFDGYLMEDPFPSFSSLSKLIISRSFPVGRLLVAEKLL